MTTQKKILQEYLNEGFDYSHRIDVEPTPYYPVQQDELNQIMRTLLFRINKKYLRSKYFPKWKPADKFWIVGCRQGGKNKNSETHYHLLLHTPKNHRVDILEDLIQLMEVIITLVMELEFQTLEVECYGQEHLMYQ